MGEENGTPLFLITNPHRNPGKVNLEGGMERSRKGDGKIEFPSPQGKAESRILPEGAMKRDDLINKRKCFPEINQALSNKDSDMGLREKGFQPLNRGIGKESVPHPVYPSD
jgi:hypothetical protein